MTFEQRLAEIRDRLRETSLDRVVAVHDGAHFIEKPDPAKVLTELRRSARSRRCWTAAAR